MLVALAGASISGCAGGSGSPARPVALCRDVTFPIYFASKSAALTDNAQEVVDAAATQVKGCRIGYVSVLGLTDANGTPADNLSLSKARAAVVASALSKAGVVSPRLEVQGAGEEGAVTEHGKPVPLRRKTEVVIHALPA